MSYEPTLVIRKSDLEKNRKLIEASEWEYIPSIKFKGKWAVRDKIYLEQAMAELQTALNIGTVKFPEIEVVIIQPEGTMLGNNVRDLMEKLKIDFRIDS